MSVCGDGVEAVPPKKFKIDFPTHIFKAESEENNNSEEDEFLTRQRTSIDWSDDVRKSESTFDRFDGHATTVDDSDGDAPPASTTAANLDGVERSHTGDSSAANNTPPICFPQNLGDPPLGTMPGFPMRLIGNTPLDFFQQLSLFSRRASGTNLSPAGTATTNSPPASAAGEPPGMFDFQLAMLLQHVGQANANAALMASNKHNNNSVNVNNGCLDSNGSYNNGVKMPRKKPKANDFPLHANPFNNDNKNLLEPRDAKAIAASLFSKKLGGIALPGTCRSRQSTPLDVSPASNGSGVGASTPTIPIPGALAVAASPAAILFSQDDWSWHRNPAASIRSGGTNKQTPVWKYFVYNKAENLSRCIVGTCTYTLKGPHTSTLACHLKKHPIQYAEFQNLKSVYTRERSAEQMSNASSARVGSANSSTPRPSLHLGSGGFDAQSEAPSLAPSTSPCSSTFVESRNTSPKPKTEDGSVNSPSAGTSDDIGHAYDAIDVSSETDMQSNFAQAAAAAAAALNSTGAGRPNEHFSTNIFGQQVGAVNAAQARFVAAMATAAALNSRKRSTRASPENKMNDALAKRSNAKSSQSMSNLLEVLNRRAAALANSGAKKPNEFGQTEDDCPTFARLMESKIDDDIAAPEIRLSSQSYGAETSTIINKLVDDWDAEKLSQRRIERQLALTLLELGVSLQSGLSSRALESLLQETRPNFKMPDATTLNEHLEKEHSRIVVEIKRQINFSILPISISININKFQKADESSEMIYSTSFTAELMLTDVAVPLAFRQFESFKIIQLESVLNTILTDFNIDANRIRVIHICGPEDSSVLAENWSPMLLKRVVISKNSSRKTVSELQRKIVAHEHFSRCDRAFRTAIAQLTLSETGVDVTDARAFGGVRKHSDVLLSVSDHVEEMLRESVDKLLPLAIQLNAFDVKHRHTFNDLFAVLGTLKEYVSKSTNSLENDFKVMIESELWTITDNFCSNKFPECARFVCPSLGRAPSKEIQQYFHHELVQRLRKKYGDPSVIRCSNKFDTFQLSPEKLDGSALCSDLIEAANRRIHEIESNDRSWGELVDFVLDEYVNDLSNIHSPNSLEIWQKRVAEIHVTSAVWAVRSEFAQLAAEILNCPTEGAPASRAVSLPQDGDIFYERNAIIRANMSMNKGD